MLNATVLYFLKVYSYNAHSILNEISSDGKIDTVEIDKDIERDALPLLIKVFDKIIQHFQIHEIIYKTDNAHLPFACTDFLSLMYCRTHHPRQLTILLPEQNFLLYKGLVQRQFSYLNKEVFWYFLEQKMHSPGLNSHDSFWHWWIYFLPLAVECNQYLIEADSIGMLFLRCVNWTLFSFTDYFASNRQPIEQRESIFFSLLLFVKFVRYMAIGMSLMQSVPHKNSPVKKTILSALWCYYFYNEYETLKKDDLLFFFLHTGFDCLKRRSTQLPCVRVKEDKDDQLYIKKAIGDL